MWIIISAFVRGELSRAGVGQQRLLVDGRGLWHLPLLWPRVSIARTCECCDRFGMQEASHRNNLFIISSQLPGCLGSAAQKRREMEMELEQGSS